MRKLTEGLSQGEKGFTLIEMLVVIAILGTIAAIVVPNFGSLSGRGQAEVCQLEERMVTTVAIAYSFDTGECPTEIGQLDDYLDDPSAIQGSYTFSGTFPSCVVEQTECPASETPGPGPGPKPKPKPEPWPWGPFNPWGPWWPQ
jgi:prepilin-type N-terminal cleavage/methylation domain-containing protein